MVTIVYDAGGAERAEIEPVDNDFEYVAAGDYWAVTVDTDDDHELVKWIPHSRIYEIEGARERIHPKRP
jgi:hypothetical protein